MVEVCGGPVVAVAGERLPAMSISWEQSEHPERWTGHIVFMSECDLEIDYEEWPKSEGVCLHCVIRDGDQQLARGLDLAKIYGQVDYDLDRGEWIIPANNG